MEHKHTPGPWAANGDGEVWATSPIRFNLTTAGTPMVAEVCRHDDAEGGFPWKGNARLLAAAPDLLEALVTAERFMSGFEGDGMQVGIEGHLWQIRAAIARATGTPSNQNQD